MEIYPKILKKVLRELVKKDSLNIFFTHIQKTGGTSIDDAIGQYFRKSDHSRIFAAPSYKTAELLVQESSEKSTRKHVWKIRQYLVAYEMAKGTKYISGHIPFKQEIWEEFHKDYIYLTVLRNPVKRFISKYFYNAFKESEHLKTKQNLQYIIDSDYGQDWGSEYVRFISGWTDVDDCTSADVIQKAKDNLDKFNVIGFLEDLDVFVEDFYEVSGLRIQIPHKRENPILKPDLDKSTIRSIERLCQPDIEIYEYAKERFLGNIQKPLL